jgi:hypothetical protein
MLAPAALTTDRAERAVARFFLACSGRRKASRCSVFGPSTALTVALCAFLRY